MRYVLGAVLARKQGLKTGPARNLFQSYVDRIAPYAPVEVAFNDTETALLERFHRDAGRTAPYLVLLDSRGATLTSEIFATRLRTLRDSGIQQVALLVGPASGWSSSSRAAASLLLSLGPMILPHELALVVLAEQIYRAQTILAGHPYHCGH